MSAVATAELVRYERHGAVAEVVLDAPPQNVFGADLVLALRGVLRRAAADRPRALIFRAEGPVFTAGADVELFAAHNGAGARTLVAESLAVTHLLEAQPCPTIALVHGHCFTAGFELSLACDHIWAARRARFGLVEAQVGIVPLMGGTQRLAARAGGARALAHVQAAEAVRAEVLEGWGVVGAVFDDADTLLARGRAFAERLAQGPTQAYVAARRTVRAVQDAGVAAADAALPSVAAPLFDTHDARMGFASFIDQGPGLARFAGE